ncbi:MAG: tRNA uridine-5-carboxymethylaminomethyl(34) synthesis GTPase MnmE [Mycoplasmatales bacterium]
MSNICAISTGLSTSGISVIRCSGFNILEQVSKILKQPILDQKPNTIEHNYLYINNKVVDEVLISYFQAPKSFTGEDVIEINIHGGVILTKKVLNYLLDLDFKLAQPGEFSKRAFLNNKKSLNQLEVFNDIINAKSEKGLDISLNSLNNDNNLLLSDISNDLIQIINNISVNIDYPEYDDTNVDYSNLNSSVLNIKERIDSLIFNTQKGELLKNGINTAIIGKTNVGKSSLLNKLADKDKAIVTDIQGTTRDVVESEVLIDGVLINLYDTAGIRQSDNKVESIGIDKSKEIINKVDLVLYMIDGTQNIDQEDKEIYNLIKDKPHLVIVNKYDLYTESRLKELNADVEISIETQHNLDVLKDHIFKKIDILNLDYNKMLVLSSIEDLSNLELAQDKLDLVLKNIENKQLMDTIEIDLKEILFIINDILKKEVKEDLLNDMFSRFCLGK